MPFAPRPIALPPIHDASGCSPRRVAELVQEALTGLGFPAGSPEGPNAGDLIFVGRHYIAWIDETGFFGKMNALWLLNDAPGDALDFVVREHGRPVNALIVAERGDGQFASSYQGAEHAEFPSRTPEENDDPSCATRDWCNQYGLEEAVEIVNPRIPWWSACNARRPSFMTRNVPVVADRLADGGLRIVFEGPLVKTADGDGTYDGDACGADYLFQDRIRRRVLLRVGYELHPGSPNIDRTQQIVNPTGNPPFAGDMSLIGGFVLTAHPNEHPLKRWSSPDLAPRPGVDAVLGWANRPLTFTTPEGRTATIANVGAIDNADVGACFCSVHGAIELGGGLLHAGISLPILGGQATTEARRRLTLR